jgi:hypothetical protein
VVRGSPVGVRIRDAILDFNVLYNSWNICKATSHCFLDCSLDQGTIIKAKWQLSSKCPSSYSTLKTSIASRIRTTTGGLPNQSQNRSCLSYECSFYIQSSLQFLTFEFFSRFSILTIPTSHPAPADFTSLIIPTSAPHQSILQISHTSLQYVFHRLFKTIELQFRDA